MTFIVILVTLLIERFFDWSHLRQWSWYEGLERIATQKLNGASPNVVLAAVVIPPMILAVICKMLFGEVLYQFPWLLIQVVVVLYCYGPKNLWADAYASISCVTGQSSEQAAETLRNTFNINTSNTLESVQQQLTNQIIIAANQRVFAIVFWYGFFGIPGAIFYRLTNISAQNSEAPSINALARHVQEALDWVTVRVLSLIFALGGNFNRVLSCWRQRVSLGLDGNNIIMTECGLAAITDDADKSSTDGALEKSAVNLLDRAFIIVLVITLVLTRL